MSPPILQQLQGAFGRNAVPERKRRVVLCWVELLVSIVASAHGIVTCVLSFGEVFLGRDCLCVVALTFCRHLV